ncbi:MAG TPA: DNA polymerase ligase N-terminal domain-containing protein [Vicinamibacterales bacterium]
MALDEYRRKRDFTRSPEPTGDPEKTRRTRKAKPLFFCVQKHLASHLHYDFRLEHDGVLLSWAVPKGPSLDPTIKRLAMHVEDHPFEYGRFEGVIPEGYGAGLVMLWDEGTWTPEIDVADGLAKGDLKFRLDGYKLKGSWALIRTRGYGGERGSGKSWLLIKHKDEWSGDLDIAEFAPLSVKSGEDFPEILAKDQPDLWRSGRPAAGGATGAMLREIIEKAAALKLERAQTSSGTRRTSMGRVPSKGARKKTRA